MTEQTREAVDAYLRRAGRAAGQCLFLGRRGPGEHLTTRQYARLVGEWVASISAISPYTVRGRRARLTRENAPVLPRFLDSSSLPVFLRVPTRPTQPRLDFEARAAFRLTKTDRSPRLKRGAAVKMGVTLESVVVRFAPLPHANGGTPLTSSTRMPPNTGRVREAVQKPPYTANAANDSGYVLVTVQIRTSAMIAL
jgi:hypothetical protein